MLLVALRLIVTEVWLCVCAGRPDCQHGDGDGGAGPTLLTLQVPQCGHDHPWHPRVHLRLRPDPGVCVCVCVCVLNVFSFNLPSV